MFQRIIVVLSLSICSNITNPNSCQTQLPSATQRAPGPVTQLTSNRSYYCLVIFKEFGSLHLSSYNSSCSTNQQSITSSRSFKGMIIAIKKSSISVLSYPISIKIQVVTPASWLLYKLQDPGSQEPGQ